MAESPPQTPQRKGTYWKKIAIIEAVIILILLVIAFPSYIIPHPHATPIFPQRVIIKGTITIDANRAYFVPFGIPEESSTIRVYDIKVTGSFSLSDNQTIRVYITDGSSNSKPNYDSGLASSGTIDVNLPSGGTYYLYYDNTEFTMQGTAPAKNVSTTATLTFTMIGK